MPMVQVRRVIETPLCRRTVHIDIRDFLLSERELAAKYGVPWDNGAELRQLFWTATLVGVFCVGFAALWR